MAKIVDFLLLAAILVACLFGLYYYQHLVVDQILVTLLLGVGYVFWGILHHLRTGDLKMKVVMEYIAMAALVVFILVALLLRV